MEKKWIKFGVPLTGFSKKGENMTNFANEIKYYCFRVFRRLGATRVSFKKGEVFGGNE